jgi:hypothetical protein
MLAQKTGSRNGGLSGISFVLIIVLALALFIVALPRLIVSTSPTTSTGDGFTTYHNSDYHYSISYPVDWQIVPPASGSNALTLASQVAKPEQAGGRYSLKSLDRATPSSTSSLNFSKVDIIAYELESNLSAIDFLASKSRGAVDGQISNLKVAGQDAIMVEVQTARALAQREENLLYRSVFVTKGNYGYILAGFADDATFDRILQSFSIEN